MCSWNGVSIAWEVERKVQKVISGTLDGRLMRYRYHIVILHYEMYDRTLEYSTDICSLPSKSESTDRPIDDPGLKARVLIAEYHGG